MSNQPVLPNSRAPLEFDFIPNQIQLLVRHNNQEPSRANFDNLRGALNSQLGRALGSRGEPLTFRANGQPTFSVLTLDAGLPNNQARNIQPIVNGINNLPNATLTGILQNAGFSTGAAPGQGRPLVAEPNWFSMSANHGQGTGGNGSWPTPSNPDAPDPSNLPAPSVSDSAQSVTLALLDTHLTSAGQQHISPAILNRLAFQMPMPASAQAEVAGHFVNGHPYAMTSHGVFGAYQAIRLIDKVAAANPNFNASQIPIVIYEALNSSGVGSLAYICQILQTLNQQLTTTPQRLVINFSLVLHAPAGEAATLQAICDLLESQGAVIVAAAGNEAKRSYNAGPNRPEPMQPAAFGSVLGVSALAGTGTAGFTPAPYSNLSDSLVTGSNQRHGFAAVGGGSTDFDAVTEIYKQSAPEVNGPFVDAFPAGEANLQHWAYWSGTSFAAPRVAALAAVLFATGTYATNSPANRQDIEAAINSLCVTSYTSPDNEPEVKL